MNCRECNIPATAHELAAKGQDGKGICLTCLERKFNALCEQHTRDVLKLAGQKAILMRELRKSADMLEVALRSPACDGDVFGVMHNDAEDAVKSARAALANVEGGGQ